MMVMTVTTTMVVMLRMSNDGDVKNDKEDSDGGEVSSDNEGSDGGGVGDNAGEDEEGEYKGRLKRRHKGAAADVL